MFAYDSCYRPPLHETPHGRRAELQKNNLACGVWRMHLQSFEFYMAGRPLA